MDKWHSFFFFWGGGGIPGGLIKRPDFIIVVNRFFTKLFKTNNIDVVNYCRMQFNFELLRNVVENLQISIGCVTMLFASHYSANDVFVVVFLLHPFFLFLIIVIHADHVVQSAWILF